MNRVYTIIWCLCSLNSQASDKGKLINPIQINHKNSCYSLYCNIPQGPGKIVNENPSIFCLLSNIPFLDIFTWKESHWFLLNVPRVITTAVSACNMWLDMHFISQSKKCPSAKQTTTKDFHDSVQMFEDGNKKKHEKVSFIWLYEVDEMCFAWTVLWQFEKQSKAERNLTWIYLYRA